MAVSPMHDSKGSLASFHSNSKLKQSSTWEIRRYLKTRRNGLHNTNKNEESVNTDRPIVCYSPNKSPILDAQSSVAVSTSAVERAERVQANLSPQFPSFLKHMLKSHVTGGFWLGLPKGFCLAHLPNHDDTVVLVDENGQECNTKYLVDKNGLSAGWRGFSIAHKLLEGDVLVFQLIEPCRFKVYIVRARRLTEVDRATSLFSLNPHAEPMEAVKMMLVKMEDRPEEYDQITETAKSKYLELVPMDSQRKKDTVEIVPITEPAADQSGDDSNNFGSEIMDGIRFSESLLRFKDVNGFEDFNVHVDGLIIDSEIPTHLRTKYYELCRSQNMFLHDNLIQGLNSKLAAGMISETINIADAIRATKPRTSHDHLESWDKTLKAFEDLGMVVGFLRARIHKLLSISRESQAKIELKRSERAEAEEEMRVLKKKLSDVKMRMENLDAEIDALEVKNNELGFVFKEVVDAPW